MAYSFVSLKNNSKTWGNELKSDQPSHTHSVPCFGGHAVGLILKRTLNAHTTH